MLNWFKSFIARLFASSRKGLESFLKENLPMIKRSVAAFIKENADKKFHEIEPLVFTFLRAKLPSVVPDNFIAIGIKFAFEHIKTEAVDSLEK